MRSALIGYTGFVGSNLLRQGQYDDLYHSRNIEAIYGKLFDRIVCAGMPGAKWKAIQEPGDDYIAKRRLGDALGCVYAKTFILISTVDVGDDNVYGRNRARLEDCVSSRFDDFRIVRLPALFGPGLKKNVLYDLMHGHRVEFINPDSWYQWYPISHLSADIERIEANNYSGVTTLATAPIETREIRDRFFPSIALFKQGDLPVNQDIRPYCLTKGEVLAEMGKWIEEERNGRTQYTRMLATADQGARD